jgi:aryl-alcohol dehydrogenase-like predicted oxidoreductase
MHYRRLGRTDWDVSAIGHGLWGMGSWTGGDEDEARSALRRSVQLGCNFFDSAWVYGHGRSDQLLGELLAEVRSGGASGDRAADGEAGDGAVGGGGARRLYAASKVPPKNMVWPGLPEQDYDDVYPDEHVLEYAEITRRNLGVERIDLLHLHTWDDSWTPRLAGTVALLRERGLIDAFGISLNIFAPHNGLEALRTGLVDVVQVMFNVFEQSPADELFGLCEELDVGVIARVPFDEGSLTGTLSADTRFPDGDWRAGYFGPDNLPPTLERVAALERVVPAGMTLPELALRFVLAEPRVDTTIPGMRRMRHVEANLAAADAEPLSPELLDELRRHRWDRAPAPWAN